MKVADLKVCGSCSSAIRQESRESGFPLKGKEAKIMAYRMGGDIVDHVCKTVENGKGVCHCGCRRHR